MTLLDKTKAYVRDIVGPELPEEVVLTVAKKILTSFHSVDDFGGDFLCNTCGRSRTWPNVSCSEPHALAHSTEDQLRSGSFSDRTT